MFDDSAIDAKRRARKAQIAAGTNGTARGSTRETKAEVVADLRRPRPKRRRARARERHARAWDAALRIELRGPGRVGV